MESFLLALVGAAIGYLIAYVGLKGLVAVIPNGAIPGEAVIQLNIPVLFFSLGMAVLTTLLFGLAPAIQMAKRDVSHPFEPFPDFPLRRRSQSPVRNPGSQ